MIIEDDLINYKYKIQKICNQKEEERNNLYDGSSIISDYDGIV